VVGTKKSRRTLQRFFLSSPPTICCCCPAGARARKSILLALEETTHKYIDSGVLRLDLLAVRRVVLGRSPYISLALFLVGLVYRPRVFSPSARFPQRPETFFWFCQRKVLGDLKSADRRLVISYCRRAVLTVPLRCSLHKFSSDLVTCVHAGSTLTFGLYSSFVCIVG